MAEPQRPRIHLPIFCLFPGVRGGINPRTQCSRLMAYSMLLTCVNWGWSRLAAVNSWRYQRSAHHLDSHTNPPNKQHCSHRTGRWAMCFTLQVDFYMWHRQELWGLGKQPSTLFQQASPTVEQQGTEYQEGSLLGCPLNSLACQSQQGCWHQLSSFSKI